MKENYTLWERIISDTPAFFKKVQVIALGLAGLGGTLATIPGIPANWSTVLISAGTAIAAIAQFAVDTQSPEGGVKEPSAPSNSPVSHQTK